ncbi:MAG: PQQ-dependent sugar dehydrogenase [Crocinitomicaceae bacterium]|nr:PQQ-dependent sugar dehydrogenase [Crocinitomicaceae bacterium]
MQTKYFEKLKTENIFMDIYTDRYDESIYGFIVDFNDEFVLLEHYTDIGEIGGIAILKRENISRIKWAGNNIHKSTSMKKFFSICISIIISFSMFSQTFTRSELSTAVSTPWEIMYGPDDFLWITESGGRVSRVDPSNGAKTVIYTAPDYFGGSPLENSPHCPNSAIGSGTLGLALHPDFSNSNTSFIYFLYSYNSGTAQTPATKFRIKRLTWNASTSVVTSDSNIVNLISTGYDHLGGRLAAIKQNNISYLFLSLGDNGISEQNSPNCYSPQSSNPNNFAQDITTQNGKIHRFNVDGTIPIDNPVAGNSFYTRGHRNPQGLMYNSDLDIIYAIEHGDRTDDEINILHKGMNYGWKNARGYHDDNSFPGEADFVANYIPNPLITNDSLVEPFFAWCTTPDTSQLYTDWCTVAPSAGMYYGNTGIPQWTNSLLVVTLKNGLTTDNEVYQFKLQPNGELVPSTIQNPNPKRFFGADQALNGRLRDIAISTDGKSIYLINNGGTPADKITVYHYDSTLSVNNDVQLPNIQLFPNPVTDILTIQGLADYSGLKEIQITTLLGQETSVEMDENHTINVSKLNNGIYFVNLIFENKTHAMKFVKN